MKNLLKKMFMMSSIVAAAAILSGCMGCPNKRHHKKPQPQQQTTEEVVVFYQTYENADVSRVKAQMYTRNGRGGESKMGYIKFAETDAGLKMMVNLTDLRPNINYTVKLYQCGNCNDSTCCDQNPMAINLPTLRINKAGRLEESFIVRGLTATQLKNAKIYLERDGGYKASWGRLEQQ